jgi:hypothetical protein
LPLEHVYVMTDLPINPVGNTSFTVAGERLYYDVTSETETAVFSSSLEGNDAKVAWTKPEDVGMVLFTADDYGNFYVITVFAPAPDVAPTYTLSKFTIDGKELFSADITAEVSPNGPGLLAADDYGVYFFSQTGLAAYDAATGEKAFALIDHISMFAAGADGRLIYCTSVSTQDPLNPNYYSVKETMKTVDFAAKTGVNEIALSGAYGEMIRGSGDYAFYYRTSGDGILGVSAKTGADTEVVNFLNSDLDFASLGAFAAARDGTFIIARIDYETGAVVGFSRLTHNPDATLGGKTLITLGTQWLDGTVKSAVLAFNRTSPDTRISITDYSLYSTASNPFGGSERMNMDLLAGTAPDILSFVVGSGTQPESYITKGMLEDLNPYLDADASVDRADLFENVLEAGSRDGKLYRLMPVFTPASLVGKASTFPKTDYTLDELAEILAAHPDSHYMFYTTAQDWINMYARTLMSEFVDLATFTAHYDSPKFIAALEFSKKIPIEYDWANIDPATYVTDMQEGYKNGKILLTTTAVISPDAVLYNEQTFGEAITYIHYPDSGKYMLSSSCELAINSASKNKDAAWKFLSSTLQPAFALINPNTLTINRASFENGIALLPSDVTEAEIAQARSVVETATGGGGFDMTVQNIIIEECGAFYAGVKTAEETAKVIQSRVSLYINEKK